MRDGSRAVRFCAVLVCISGACAQTTAPRTDESGAVEVKKQKAPVVQPSQEPKPNEWRKLLVNIAGDQKAIWTSPFRMSRETAPWWAGFGGATAFLIATDHWTSTQLPNTSDQIAVARWTSRLGASYSIIPITASFWAVGRFTDSPRAREVGRIGVEALLNSFLVDTALKTVTMRQRPLEGDGHGRFWHGKGRPWNAGSSWPSGHAIYSWTLASVIAHEFPRPRIIPITSYALATTVIASRFAVRRHFASDVVSGAAMGWFIGHYVFGRRHNPELGPPGQASRPNRALSFVANHVTFSPVFAPPAAMNARANSPFHLP